MLRYRCGVALSILGICLTSLTMDNAYGQPPQGRSVFPVARVPLATLEAVQAELKLNEEQVKIAKQLNEQLNSGRREVFQGGDFETMRAELRKLEAKLATKLDEKLDDGQKQRLTEVFIQSNGPNALSDKVVSETLSITEEQSKKLAGINDTNWQDMFDMFQDFQSMSDEERSETVAEYLKTSDKRLLDALTAEQREQFTKLHGKKLEVDLTPILPRRGG